MDTRTATAIYSMLVGSRHVHAHTVTPLIDSQGCARRDIIDQLTVRLRHGWLEMGHETVFSLQGLDRRTRSQKTVRDTI